MGELEGRAPLRDVLSSTARSAGPPHTKLEQFDFPHKSILNTNAEFTKERRRSGFEAYFALLLSLGPNYAPFVETFLKADERALDDSGHSRPATPTPVAQRPAVVFDDDEDDDDSTIAIQQPSLVLERPRSLTHWALCFYLPVSLVTYAHCCVLTLLGAFTAGKRAGPARRPIGAARVCVALALVAAVDDRVVAGIPRLLTLTGSREPPRVAGMHRSLLRVLHGGAVSVWQSSPKATASATLCDRKGPSCSRCRCRWPFRFLCRRAFIQAIFSSHPEMRV